MPFTLENTSPLTLGELIYPGFEGTANGDHTRLFRRELRPTKCRNREFRLLGAGLIGCLLRPSRRRAA